MSDFLFLGILGVGRRAKVRGGLSFASAERMGDDGLGWDWYCKDGDEGLPPSTAVFVLWVFRAGFVILSFPVSHLIAAKILT